MLDPPEWKYFIVNDKNIEQMCQKQLSIGSVWVVAGRNYEYDRQLNTYILRRVDKIEE